MTDLSSPANWPSLVKTLETTLSTPNSSHQQICDDLDRLIDEIKSGEKIPISDLPSILSVLLSLFEPQTMWCHKHLSCFAIIEILKRSLVEDADTNRILDDFLDRFVEKFLRGVCDPKREQRDAIAQTLGVLCHRFGSTVVREKLLPNLQQIEKDKTQVGVSYTCLEGLMMSLGYIGSCCLWKSDSEEDTATLVGIARMLLMNVASEIYGEYSRYIRTQALRGLRRLVVSEVSGPILVAQPRFFEFVLGNLWARFKDKDFDVRVATAQLYADLLARKADEEQMRGVPQLLGKWLREGVMPWEERHAYCLGLAECCMRSEFVRFWDPVQVVNMLGVELRRNPSRGDPWMPNAVIGSAMAHLVTSMAKLGSEEDLAAAKQVFESGTLDGLRFMLKSPEAHLLDVSARCLDLLLACCSDFVDSFLPEFSCHVYKNRFHAAFPIRNSATKIWKKVQGMGRAVEKDEDLLKVLVEEARVENYEVREAALKAIDSVLTKEDFECRENDVLSLVVQILMEGCIDDRGRMPEVPKAAAITALSSMMTHLSRISLPELVDLDAVLRNLSEDVSHIYEGSVCSCSLSLFSACCLEVFRSQVGEKLEKLLPALFCLTKTTDEDLAQAARSALEKFVDDVPAFFQSNLPSFLSFASEGAFRFGDDVEWDLKETLSKLLLWISSIVRFEDVEFEIEGVAQTVFDFVRTGVISEDDFDEIEANALSFFSALTCCPSFVRCISNSQDDVKELVLYCLNLLSDPRNLKSRNIPSGESTLSDSPVHAVIRAKCPAVIRVLVDNLGETQSWKDEVLAALGRLTN